MTPAIILGAGDLGVDEAIDAFVADREVSALAAQAPGDLLGGPTLGKAAQNDALQLGLAFEARAHPAPCPRLLMGIARLVSDLSAAIASYLPSNGRWRAIQSCRDLLDRAPFGLKAGNLAPIFQ